jgi:Flp pilus assembly protein TadG
MPAPLTKRRTPKARTQAGATAVEFAMVLGLLLTLVLGVMDLGRWLAAAASLHEAARTGARLAVVCDLDDPQVSSRALARLVGLNALAQAPAMTISREPAGCTTATCERLRVALSGAAMQGAMPWWGSGLPLPTAQVELPRESLASQIDGRNNPQCL